MTTYKGVIKRCDPAKIPVTNLIPSFIIYPISKQLLEKINSWCSESKVLELLFVKY